MDAYKGANDEWRQAICGHAARRTQLKLIESNARSVLAKKSQMGQTRRSGNQKRSAESQQTIWFPAQ